MEKGRPGAVTCCFRAVGQHPRRSKPITRRQGRRDLHKGSIQQIVSRRGGVAGAVKAAELTNAKQRLRAQRGRGREHRRASKAAESRRALLRTATSLSSKPPERLARSSFPSRSSCEREL
eukprot:1593441-Pleurochrysis_carterae.AAC.1